MSTSLMARAKTLLCSKGCAAALAIVPLAAVVNQAHASVGVFFTLNSHSATGGNIYGGNYASSTFTLTGSPITNGIKMSGQFGPISGSDYIGDPTTLDMSGTFTGTIFAGQAEATSFNFTPTFTGGTARLASITSSVDGLNASAFPNALLTSGVPFTTSIQSSPEASPVTNGSFDVQLRFTWSPGSLSDSFTLTIPNNSIDTRITPEPGTALTVLLPALTWLAAKRRRQIRISSQAP